MKIDKIRVSVTTDASGDFSDTTNHLNGLLLKIHYVPAAANELDNGWGLVISETSTRADATTTTEAIYTEAAIGTTAFSKYPRWLVHDGADGSVTTAYDYIPVDGKLTVTVASGGNAQSGDIYLYVGKN